MFIFYLYIHLSISADFLRRGKNYSIVGPPAQWYFLKGNARRIFLWTVNAAKRHQNDFSQLWNWLKLFAIHCVCQQQQNSEIGGENNFDFKSRRSMSWKWHQFHPDGDSRDIIGNILDHLLNLFRTSRYMMYKVKHRDTIPLLENQIQKMKIWGSASLWCVCVCNWTIHVSRQLCYLHCISYITYLSCSQKTNQC